MLRRQEVDEITCTCSQSQATDGGDARGGFYPYATYFTFSNQTKLNQSIIIIIYLPIFPCVQHTSLYTTAAPPFSSLKPASNRLHRTINSIRHHHGVTFLIPINQWHVYWLWLMHFGGLDQVNKRIFIWTCWKIKDAFLQCIPSLLCHATSLKRHAGHMEVSRPRVIGDASSDIKTAGVPKLISPVNSNEGGGGLCYASRRFSLRRVRIYAARGYSTHRLVCSEPIAWLSGLRLYVKSFEMWDRSVMSQCSDKCRQG